MKDNPDNSMIPGVALESALEAARIAGLAIIDVYNDDFEVFTKTDNSPVTEADKRAHDIIFEHLSAATPEIPVLSEESAEVPFEIRRLWETFWLVDPLDGTREFVKRNGEFTVNIALIHNCRPVLGVVYIPVTGRMFHAMAGAGAFVFGPGEEKRLLRTGPTPSSGRLILAGSRSYRSKALENYIAEQEQRYDTVDYVPAGSSLKFCLVAEGKADVYPRLGPTMEWDTAAPQIIAEESGKRVVALETGKVLVYNKPDLRNPWFICH